MAVDVEVDAISAAFNVVFPPQETYAEFVAKFDSVVALDIDDFDSLSISKTKSSSYIRDDFFQTMPQPLDQDAAEVMKEDGEINVIQNSNELHEDNILLEDSNSYVSPGFLMLMDSGLSCKVDNFVENNEEYGYEQEEASRTTSLGSVFQDSGSLVMEFTID